MQDSYKYAKTKYNYIMMGFYRVKQLLLVGVEKKKHLKKHFFELLFCNIIIMLMKSFVLLMYNKSIPDSAKNKQD